jgi:4-hydroxy-tetrahydrodipicolinate reductase
VKVERSGNGEQKAHMSGQPIRVAVSGARGKMGVTTIAALRAADGIAYAGGLVRDRPGSEEYDDAARLFAQAKPDVVVEFTHFPDSKRIAIAAMNAGVRPVIGTSGYGADDVEELRLSSERTRVGCVFAPNFGIGAVLMMKFAADAARFYDHVEIIEMHETGKKDAPSGTAMATARRMAAAGTFRRPETQTVKAIGARGAEMNGIGIHSLRLPGVVAHQEVLFGGGGETLRIVHDSTSRESFMPGVLLAVRAARHLDHFVEGLEPLL